MCIKIIDQFNIFQPLNIDSEIYLKYFFYTFRSNLNIFKKNVDKKNTDNLIRNGKMYK